MNVSQTIFPLMHFFVVSLSPLPPLSPLASPPSTEALTIRYLDLILF